MPFDPVTLTFLITFVPIVNPGYLYIIFRDDNPSLSEAERVRKAIGDTLKVTFPGFLFALVVSYWTQPFSPDWAENAITVCLAYLGVLVLALRWG